MKEKIKNLLYIFGPLLLGGLVGLLTKNSMEYNTLIKPPFSPPNNTFPIVWSILYLLIGHRDWMIIAILYSIGLIIPYLGGTLAKTIGILTSLTLPINKVIIYRKIWNNSIIL